MTRDGSSSPSSWCHSKEEDGHGTIPGTEYGTLKSPGEKVTNLYASTNEPHRLLDVLARRFGSDLTYMALGNDECLQFRFKWNRDLRLGNKLFADWAGAKHGFEWLYQTSLNLQTSTWKKIDLSCLKHVYVNYYKHFSQFKSSKTMKTVCSKAHLPTLFCLKYCKPGWLW